MTIGERQNSEYLVQVLAAQRAAYTRAKAVAWIRFVLAIPCIVTLSILSKYIDTIQFAGHSLGAEWLIAYGSLLVIVAETTVLDRRVSQLRRLGAKLQELFDSNLLCLVWNDVICGDRPVAEEVTRYCKRFVRRRSINEVKDWYSSEVQFLEVHLAAPICQRINLGWDLSLRKSYRSAMDIAFTLVLMLLVFLGLWRNVSLRSVLIAAVAALPAFLLWIRQRSSNTASIGWLERALCAVEHHAHPSESIGTAPSARSIQDGIYLHRAAAVLIPNLFYDVFRSTSAAGADAAVRAMVDAVRD